MTLKRITATATIHCHGHKQLREYMRNCGTSFYSAIYLDGAFVKRIVLAKPLTDRQRRRLPAALRELVA